MFEPLKTAVEKVSRLVSTASSSLSSIDDPVLDSDRGVQRIGYAIVIFVFAGFGVWASFAPLESAAFGIGFVQVEGDTKPVQHLEGGIVSKILVKSGDRVTRGQPVLLLESTQLVSEKKNH
jgi:epimerase transport system membrane fusion protein